MWNECLWGREGDDFGTLKSEKFIKKIYASEIEGANRREGLLGHM